MGKQIAYLAFLVTIMGQFILAPVMAMPKYLVANTHSMAQQNATIQPPLTQATLFNQATQLHNVNAIDNLHEATSIAQTNNSENCDSNVSLHQSIKVDCDAVCEQLTASNCVSHCISTPGITDDSQLSLLISNSSSRIQTHFWSLQTVELSSKNPPPINA